MFAYRTTIHASTGVSPFEIMFGCPPHQLPLPEATAYDVASYQNQQHSKLAQLSDFVETHMTEAAQKQKLCYDQHTTSRSFKPGDSV